MLVSVTIPVYNDNEGLKRSLVSLINQTYAHWEAIIVDDGSEIPAKVIVDEINDRRIKYFRFNENKGRPCARQKTFELMTGNICSFLDAGDQYFDDYLEIVVENFTKNSKLIAVSQSALIKYRDKLYISKTSKVGTFNLKSGVFDNCVFAATAFLSYICDGYKFQKDLKYSQDRHFLNYVSSNFSGQLLIINSYGYLYDQATDMTISVTFKKYFFAAVRYWKEKKILNVLKTIGVGLLICIVHLFAGYERVLTLRFREFSKGVTVDIEKIIRPENI